MRKVISVFAIAVVAAGGGYAFWRYGFSDQDRESAMGMVSSLRSLIGEIRTRVEPLVEQIQGSEEHTDDANRRSTQQQWTELGF